jgi:hypothetical protein
MKKWPNKLTTRPLRRFNRQFALYGQRKIQGSVYVFRGQFAGIIRGGVALRGHWIEEAGVPKPRVGPPTRVTFRARQCFLWGLPPDSDQPRAHWFSRGLDHPAT